MLLVCHGSRDKEIAARLSISMAMVSRHIKQSIRKLNAGNRCHAVMILCKHHGW